MAAAVTILPASPRPSHESKQRLEPPGPLHRASGIGREWGGPCRGLGCSQREACCSGVLERATEGLKWDRSERDAHERRGARMPAAQER
eukprot:2291733-Rhodomonas_salina.2